MNYLSVKEVAELKGCSERYIKKCCKDGKFKNVQQELNSKGRMKYMIPVSALNEQEQAKYYKKDVSKAVENTFKTSAKQPSNTVKKELNEFSEKEQKIIAEWCAIFEEWQTVRNRYNNKTDADADYVGKCRIEHPNLKISVDILYRKYKAFYEKDYERVLGISGGHNRGESSIDSEVWTIFAGLYLRQQKPNVAVCYRTVTEWCKANKPEIAAGIPSMDTFRRRTKKELSGAVASFARDGVKKCLEKYGIYAERDYGSIEANSVWIFDNHTLDIVSISPDGKPHRMSITAIQDAKSGVIVGCNPCSNPCSESTLLAIRRANLNGFGLPRYWYLDNGSEFCATDIAGRGHRKKANWDKNGSPATVLELLGCKSIFALVANPDAKNIERFFYTFKEWFSKAQESYCGGTILERPPMLKDKIKNLKMPTDDEIMELIEIFIRSYNSSPYGGKEKKYKGMTRIEVWNESINSGRTIFRDVASKEDLNLLLARTTRYQKVKRNGVFIELYGKKIWFRNEDTPFHVDREVYVRYDPCCLDSVRVYDKESEKYLWTYFKADYIEVPYLAAETEDGREKIAAFQKNYENTRKAIKKKVEEYTYSSEAIDYAAARILEMEAGASNYEVKKPSKFEPVTAQEANIGYPERENIIEVDYAELEELRAMNDKLEKMKGA